MIVSVDVGFLYMDLTLANTWNNTWQYMLHTIENKFEKEVQKKYQNLDKKNSKKWSNPKQYTHSKNKSFTQG